MTHPNDRICEALQSLLDRAGVSAQVQVSTRASLRSPGSRARVLAEQQNSELLLWIETTKPIGAVYVSDRFREALGDRTWIGLCEQLSEDLRGTHWSNAVGIFIKTLAILLPARGITPTSSD